MTVVRVALVGAGPGDPDLVTLRAEAELAAASTVMTDMALEGLVRQLAPQAEVVMVPDGQPAASVLLAVVARADGDVVRLYSGDPWLHPAHVVELTALNRAGIGSKPVAGVSTEVAVPALAGIAVHVRHLAVACTIGPIEAMPSVLDPARTLVVLTGGDGPAVARQLAANGAPDLPAAFIPVQGWNGAVRGTLAELGRDPAPTGACLIVVGAVTAPNVRPNPCGPPARSAPFTSAGPAPGLAAATSKSPPGQPSDASSSAPVGQGGATPPGISAPMGRGPTGAPGSPTLSNGAVHRPAGSGAERIRGSSAASWRSGCPVGRARLSVLLGEAVRGGGR